MGKAMMLIVAAFGMMGAFYMMGTRQGLAETDRQLAGHQYEVVARNAALAGYQRARQLLSEDYYNAGAFAGDFAGADYAVAIVRAGNKTTVTSTGEVQDSEGGTIAYRIEAQIERELVVTIAEEPPTFMQYALLTEKNLSLSGDVEADLYVQGGATNTLNANVHTNGNLTIKGNSVLVRGFGTYVGHASANPSNALLGSFQPYYNPTNAPTVSQATALSIPGYDASLFASRVEVDRTDAGDVTLSGTYNLGGTRNDPFIWHVQGNLRTTGNTTLTGYVLFLVDGNVTFNANLSAGATGYSGADESSIALYADGNVSLGGNAAVYGQVYADGDLTFLHGTPSVYGSLTTRGSADLRGTPNIYYRPASPALTTIFQEPTVHLRLIAYSEW